MLRFAANLTYLFTELPLLERFQAAASAGFKGAELLFPYEYPAGEIAGAFRGAAPANPTIILDESWKMPCSGRARKPDIATCPRGLPPARHAGLRGRAARASR